MVRVWVLLTEFLVEPASDDRTDMSLVVRAITLRMDESDIPAEVTRWTE